MTWIGWTIIGFGGAYLGLIAAFGISMGIIILKDKRRIRKGRK